MKNVKLMSLILALALSASACGPSKKEKEADAKLAESSQKLGASEDNKKAAEAALAQAKEKLAAAESMQTVNAQVQLNNDSKVEELKAQEEDLNLRLEAYATRAQAMADAEAALKSAQAAVAAAQGQIATKSAQLDETGNAYGNWELDLVRRTEVLRERASSVYSQLQSERSDLEITAALLRKEVVIANDPIAIFDEWTSGTILPFYVVAPEVSTGLFGDPAIAKVRSELVSSIESSNKANGFATLTAGDRMISQMNVQQFKSALAIQNKSSNVKAAMILIDDVVAQPYVSFKMKDGSVKNFGLELVSIASDVKETQGLDLSNFTIQGVLEKAAPGKFEKVCAVLDHDCISGLVDAGLLKKDSLKKIKSLVKINQEVANILLENPNFDGVSNSDIIVSVSIQATFWVKGPSKRVAMELDSDQIVSRQETSTLPTLIPGESKEEFAHIRNNAAYLLVPGVALSLDMPTFKNRSDKVPYINSLVD